MNPLSCGDDVDADKRGGRGLGGVLVFDRLGTLVGRPGEEGVLRIDDA
jgi:hypothetical protein